MKKQLVIVGIILMLLVVSLSGCSTRPSSEINIDDRFFGTWEGEDESGDTALIIFFSDGAFNTSYGERGEYEIKNEKLIMTVITGDLKAVATYDYDFSNNDTNLTLTEFGGGKTLVYTKQ